MTNTTERGELVAILERNLYASEYGPEDSVDAILAAGYRKPRTVGNVADLDALAETSAILDDREGVMIRVNGCWRASDGAEFDSKDIITPATVLWEPKK